MNYRAKVFVGTAAVSSILLALAGVPLLPTLLFSGLFAGIVTASPITSMLHPFPTWGFPMFSFRSVRSAPHVHVQRTTSAPHVHVQRTTSTPHVHVSPPTRGWFPVTPAWFSSVPATSTSHVGSRIAPSNTHSTHHVGTRIQHR